MTHIGNLVRAFMATICLSAQTQALAASDAQPIHVVCDDTRLTAICDELALALSDAQSRHPVAVIEGPQSKGDAHLTLRFETARFTDSLISGHLAWRDRTGAPGAGPAVDLTVMDATINETMLRDYARQLLALTDLPL